MKTPVQRGVVAGFAELCLLSGSGWIVDGYAPGLLSGLLRTAVHLGLLSILLWACDGVLRRGRGVHVACWVWLQVALWGAVLFALPQVVFAASGGRVARLMEVLVFTLVPAVVVLIEAQRADVFGEDGLAQMVPALAGFGGVAMLLPMALPSSGTGLAWLAADGAAAVLVGVAVVRMHRLLAGAGLLAAAGLLRVGAVVCGASAVASGIGAAWGGGGVGEITRLGMLQEVLQCVMLDGPVVLLTIWLLRKMRPSGFATQYLIVPLVTVSEGYIWLRPETHWTMAVGALLAVGGSAMLLAANEAALLTD